MAVGRSIAVERWPGMLDELLGRVAGRFPRVKPRRRGPRVRAWVVGQSTPQELLALDHLEFISGVDKRGESVGNKVFVGHRRSPLWLKLKDFIQMLLGLPWE